MSEFIFMLTRNDQTIPNARAIYASIEDLGLRHVGGKDVGLLKPELAELISDIRSHGHTSYLEVVSESDDSMETSARTAVEVAADYVIGGTAVERIQKVIAGTGMKFFPYIGSVIGHPCLLRGSIHELVRSVAAATSLPLICAGSVDSIERIETLRDLGVWAFTIGTAALDAVFLPGKPLDDQLRLALAAARR